jgi:hypothetical protein
MKQELSTRELIELSLLDAMGFLDEGEREAFDRAFETTSPEVQAHVRREQTRLSQIDFLLPMVEPAPDLRSAVLEAVRRAMSETVEQETFGGIVRHEGTEVRPNPTRRRLAFVPPLLPSKRVSPVWRAGAVGFATAAVVFGVTTLRMQNDYEKLDDLIRDNAFADQTRPILDDGFQDALFNSNTRHVSFTPSGAGVQGRATLMLDPETRTAFLICHNLPSDEGREYKLVVLNDAGDVAEQIAAFSSTSGLMGKRVEVKIAANQRLAIVPPTEPGAPEAGAIFTTGQVGI